MSKADTLGAAPAFGAARTARSSRRNAIERTTGGDAAAAAAVTELPVTVVSENPDNPRNHLRNLDETVESVRSVGVILPIVVGTVEAYLRDRPDRAGDLDDGAQYVVIDGHRRLEASRRVGLATIPVRVDNARLATDEALLEAAFIANYHRDDMTDLEEAHALKQLVDYYGSQTKASKRLGIPQPTLSSKLSLLKLAPELQKDLMTGARTVEHVRNLRKLPPAEQKQKADERRNAARRKAEAQRQPDTGTGSGPADYHGVISHGTVTGRPAVDSPPPDPQDPQTKTATETAAKPGAADGVQPDATQTPEPVHQPQTVRAEQEKQRLPEQRPQPVIPAGRPLPYDDGNTIGRHLAVKMDGSQFLAAAEVMVDQCWDKAGNQPSLDLLRTMLHTAGERDPEALKPLLEEALEQLSAETANT